MNNHPYRYQLCLIGLILILRPHLGFAERLAVSSPVANIRSGPGTTYDILWKVEKYHPLATLKKSGPWYYFYDFEQDKGWIHRSLVNRKQTVITNRSKCNIRSGPGINHSILMTIEKGIPFLVIKRKGNWFHIRHADGDQGWIHNSLIW